MPCKPAALCSSLLSSQRKKQRGGAAIADVVEPVKRGGKENAREATAPASSELSSAVSAKSKPLHRSTSQVHREFLRATAGVGDGKPIFSCNSVPCCEEAYAHFSRMYPRFAETRALDQLRQEEYGHLEEEELACLDYCGFGLFSHAQQVADMAAEDEGLSSSFALSEISANLWSHALYGSAPEGSMESSIRLRIMDFLSVPVSEYSMVFTASRGSTFKLLADAYPWSASPRLVTMYDYESESVGWMEQKASEKGARVYRARFRWPSLRVCSTELKNELTAGSGKKMKGKPTKPSATTDARQGSATSVRLSVASWLDRVSLQQQQQHNRKAEQKGLFVFPVQSRVSGSKYSYQWMSLAQQNHWHVLLDASALGPKDMDSLGLSLFRPDFITASFYKLFGGDPSGFGCLLIKNSVAQSLQDSSSGTPVSGMVRIMPFAFPSQWSFSSSSTSEDSKRYDEGQFDEGRMISSFSGPVPAIDETGVSSPLDLEADEHCSPACDDIELGSIGEVSRSPYSEDGNENPFAAAVGQSPVHLASCSSMSDESLSGLHEDPVHATIQESPSTLGRRDGLPSKSRIKGLCSGLLNLHSGRVGNSGDSIGDDASVRKVVVNDEYRSRRPPSLKHVAFQTTESEDQGKPIPMGSFMSKVQHSRHGSNKPEEQIPERLMLVFKKMREEQLAFGNGQTFLGHQGNEYDHINLAKENFHHGAEDLHMDDLGQGGLETIEEIEVEAECPNESEHSDLGAAQNRPLEANHYKASVLENKAHGMVALQKENAICRETEGGFRLLGRRNADTLSLGKTLTAGLEDDSFALRSIASESRDFSSMSRSMGSRSEEEHVEGDAVIEPQLLCRSLDHADMMGLNKTSIRLRYLINWLVSSLLTLRHPERDVALVRIYGPQVRYDRGASIAFNVLDNQGRLLQPDLVRTLADQVNVSLGVGYLRNIHCHGNVLEAALSGSSSFNAGRAPSKTATFPPRVEVVTAALGLLSDFQDVYKLWSFVVKFLDPNYVENEVCSLQPSSSMHGL